VAKFKIQDIGGTENNKIKEERIILNNAKDLGL
jgi:hypothetical protein